MCVRVCGSPVCMSVCDLMYVDLYEAVTSGLYTLL